MSEIGNVVPVRRIVYDGIAIQWTGDNVTEIANAFGLGTECFEIVDDEYLDIDQDAIKCKTQDIDLNSWIVWTSEFAPVQVFGYEDDLWSEFEPA